MPMSPIIFDEQLHRVQCSTCRTRYRVTTDRPPEVIACPKCDHLIELLVVADLADCDLPTGDNPFSIDPRDIRIRRYFQGALRRSHLFDETQAWLAIVAVALVVLGMGGMIGQVVSTVADTDTKVDQRFEERWNSTLQSELRRDN